jgi:hypothetical protein
MPYCVTSLPSRSTALVHTIATHVLHIILHHRLTITISHSTSSFTAHLHSLFPLPPSPSIQVDVERRIRRLRLRPSTGRQPCRVSLHLHLTSLTPGSTGSSKSSLSVPAPPSRPLFLLSPSFRLLSASSLFASSQTSSHVPWMSSGNLPDPGTADYNQRCDQFLSDASLLVQAHNEFFRTSIESLSSRNIDFVSQLRAIT